MKTKFLLTLAAMLAVASATFAAPTGAPLTQGTFTDVIKDVNVVAADTKAATPATLTAVVKSPNLVRTGASSRAELTSPDDSVTRIGANSVFSFEPETRTVNLEQAASVPFAQREGRGIIKSGGASAAVLGSTMMCSVAVDGAFKTIFLEGKECVVTLANGKKVTLHAGQEVVVLPGQTTFGPVLTIDLQTLVDSSALIQGFSHPLVSLPLIQVVIDGQKAQVAGGTNGRACSPATRSTITRSRPARASPFRKTNISSNTNRPSPRPA